MCFHIGSKQVKLYIQRGTLKVQTLKSSYCRPIALRGMGVRPGSLALLLQVPWKPSRKYLFEGPWDCHTGLGSILLPGLAGSLSFSHQHQRRVSQLLDTMMSSTYSAVQYIACRSATSTIGALGRNQAYLYIHHNLSGDSALGGHDAEVNSRIAQIHELLCAHDGLDPRGGHPFSEVGW